MKILHVCMACTYTDGYNYQENYLSKYHAEAHETYLVTNQFMYFKDKIIRAKDKYYVNTNGVHVIRLKDKFEFLSRKVNYYIGVYKKFMETLNEVGPDIIFIHNIQFNDIRKIVKYAIKNPQVLIYADNHADFSNSGTNVISRILLKTEWRRCAQIINPFVKKFYGVLPARVDFLINVYKLPKEKCELLVMGADDELVIKANRKNCYAIREKYNIAEEDFLIVTGGKIDKFKIQTLYLMKAVKRIKLSKVKLIVFGPVVNELKDELQALVDNKKIFYEPWLTTEQSYYYFGSADIAAFPGRHSVYWEQAAGQGVPLICKYWKGTTHVDCGGNAIFLKEDSVDEIKEIIEKLMLHPKEYKKMKDVATNKAMSFFSYRAIANRCLYS